MRYGLTFLLIAAVFVVLALRLGPTSWGGIGGLVTAAGLVGPGLAYLLRRPGLLGKRSDGTIAAWARGLHASYFALCRFGWLKGRGSGPDEVLPRLFLGPRATPLQSLELRKDRPVATLDLTCELTELGTLRRGAYLCLPVLDGMAPSASQLDAGVAFIDQHRNDHLVFVHCAVGRGRSSAVVVAWMLAQGEASTVEEAVARLTEKRPAVSPNGPQRDAVTAWFSRRERPFG